MQGVRGEPGLSARGRFAVFGSHDARHVTVDVFAHAASLSVPVRAEHKRVRPGVHDEAAPGVAFGDDGRFDASGTVSA